MHQGPEIRNESSFREAEGIPVYTGAPSTPAETSMGIKHVSILVHKRTCYTIHTKQISTMYSRGTSNKGKYSSAFQVLAGRYKATHVILSSGEGHRGKSLLAN